MNTARRLGQHFLKNRSVLRAIARAVDPRDRETIIEIGPGHGELTAEIQNPKLSAEGGSSSGGKVQIIAIEKDARLAELLKETFADDENVDIVEGDALKILPTVPKTYNLESRTYKIVGNIPYYITGKLLRIVGELPHKPERCVLTLQREVAERITARPPNMNRLAAAVQFWAEPSIIRRIPPENFSPPPKVESAVLVLRSKPGAPADEAAAYDAAVGALFAQPRKTVRNNLKGRLPASARISCDDVLADAGIPGNARPQNLSVDDIRRIAESMAARFPI